MFQLDGNYGDGRETTIIARVYPSVDDLLAVREMDNES